MANPDAPSPVTAAALRALAAAAIRELLWGLRAVRREHHRWLTRAAQIPEPTLRANAIAALQDKRPLLDGAALFWTIPRTRCPDLLRLLVAFQILANYHDHASERAGTAGVSHDPARSMDNFAQVLDLGQAHQHYLPTPQHDDDGYLAALVNACRDGCRQLPHYDLARTYLILAAQRARTLDLEHSASKCLRPARLQTFATSAFGPHEQLSWFELAAGASSLMTAIASLAFAACDNPTAAEMSDTNEAYVLVATISALLDNYIDLSDDIRTGSHNYLSYYSNLDSAVSRLGNLIAEATGAVRRLPDPDRHAVIVSAMVAMYLTSDGAIAHDTRHTDLLRESAGGLTAVLFPFLTAWRTATGQRGA